MPPRLLRPKDDSNTVDGSDGSEAKAGKRRAVSSACIPCRRRKSKCDGGVPACSTCVAVYRTECTYDADSDHRRKGALKRDIQSLQQRNDALDVIVASLRALPEQEAISLLHSLRTDTNPDVIATSLRNNVHLPMNYAALTLEADFASQLGRTSGTSSAASDPTNSTPALSPLPSRSEKGSFSGASGNQSTWFRNVQDFELIEHLLELYFTWVHPFHQFFSKEHFMFDMRNARNENCSALLLHAILAFACHYSDRQMIRSGSYNSTTAGDYFFAEAISMLNLSNQPHLTTVQALGVMSLRETSQGHDAGSYHYAGLCVRMAVEMGIHSSAAENKQSLSADLRKITAWTCLNLETTASMILSRLSQLPRAAIGVELPQPVKSTDLQPWRAYIDIDTGGLSTQASHTITFLRCQSGLCSIASEMVNTFYASKDSFTSRKLASTYAQYQEWYRTLPDVFLLENTSLPHVIVLHMLYHVCILHLFRPYIKLDLRAANLFPKDTCTQSANEISSLMATLRNIYGLRRVSVTVLGILLSASTVHLLNLPAQSAATDLSQAIHDLQAMSINHPHATRVIDTIRSLAYKWNIALPEDVILGSYQPTEALPTTSTSLFYQSIPRQHSSSSRDQSLGDISKHESPFAPPEQPPPDQFDASTVPNNTFSMPMQFWPVYGHTSMPVRQFGGQEQYEYQPINNWSMLAEHQQQETRRQSAPEQQNDQQNTQQGLWQWDR